MESDAETLRWHLDPRHEPEPGRPSSGSAVALWGQLSAVPGVSSALDGTPRSPGFKSSVPIDSHVASMLDRRTWPAKPGDVMSLWAVLDEVGQRLSSPYRDMSSLPAYLYPRAEAALIERPHLLRDVEVCHRQMCAVLGEPPPAVIGTCTECSAPLRYEGTGALLCRSCGAEWDLDTLLEIVT